jgi:pimeloyl-ACP methyl ester carboxylesterase
MEVQEMRQKGEGWVLREEFSYSTGKIRYYVAGGGLPLVLVHGTPWSSYNWRHIIPALAQWWTVYFYDLLGYGQSEKYPGQDVSVGAQNQVLAALLNLGGLLSFSM